MMVCVNRINQGNHFNFSINHNQGNQNRTDRSNGKPGHVFVYVWSGLPLALDFREVREFLGALKVPCPKQTKSFISNTYTQTQHISI